MEDLELSMPIAGSGKFIELHHTGALQKAQSLWTQYCRLWRSVEVVKKHQCMCNDPTWLFEFARRCQRQKRDFDEQLRQLVYDLERKKSALEEHGRRLCSKLQDIDPFLFEASHTLAGARSLYDYEAASIGTQSLGVLKRRSIIAKHPEFSSLQLCGVFDIEELPVPDEWREKFPYLKLWVTAYRNEVCRKRIHKMIADDKRRLLSP